MIFNECAKYIIFKIFLYLFDRLARAGPRSEPTTYEVVQINGSFRRSDDAPRCVKSNGLTTGVQVIRRRGRDDGIPLHTVTGNDIVNKY